MASLFFSHSEHYKNWHSFLSFLHSFIYLSTQGMCMKNNVPWIVLGVVMVIKPIQGKAPDLEELIFREGEKQNMHTKAERWFKKKMKTKENVWKSVLGILIKNVS